MLASVLLLLKATALLLLAMGLSLSLRRAPAGVRYLVWLATLVALLLVPAMSAWSPLPLRVLPGELANLAPATETVTPPPSAGVKATNAGESNLNAPTPNAPAPNAPTPDAALPPLLVAWLGVVALLLGWLGLGALTARRIVREARVLTDPSWLDPLYETADRLDLERAPRLVMSDRVEMPFACGMLRPTVVMPASAGQWSDERRRVVLLHELAHIKRRDLLGHTAGRLVCAVYWFHPLVWSAAKQLRAESERACDDLVLASGAKASDYANHLLDIVTAVRRRGAPATALPMANKREFEGRMLAILDPAVKRTTPNRVQRLLLTLGFGAVALSIAGAAPVRRAAVPPPRGGEPIAAQNTRRDSSGRGDSVVKPRPTAHPIARPAPRESTVVAPVVRVETVPSPPLSPIPFPFPSQPDTAVIGPILRTDKSDHVRRSAAWALGGRRDGVPLLLERLRVDGSWSVREMAAWGLAASPTAEVTEALGEAMRQDQSAYVRGTAAWALGFGHGGKAAPLEAALDDSNSEVRRKALWSLGQIGLEKVPARVTLALKDENSDVRAVAAWLLTETNDKSALPAIRDAFTKETQSFAQLMLFRALLLLGDHSKEVIDRALMESNNAELRARAVRMMGGNDTVIWPWPWPWLDPRPLP